MEPDDVSGYSRQDYWIERYEKETQYNWFPSVHNSCVESICDALAAVHVARDGECQGGRAETTLRVLHLGTGNSTLCADLHAAVERRKLPFVLQQVAMDYAPNVIARMQAMYPPSALPHTSWVVGDVRHLAPFAEMGPFDVIIDKGTMDALEADKSSTTAEEDVETMLRGVSDLLSHAKGYGAFIQITWVVPYMRLHYTKREEYVWGTNVKSSLLGDSDMYRLFLYTVNK